MKSLALGTALLGLALLSLVAGCGGSGSMKAPPAAGGDPLLVVKDAEANTAARVRAVERAWEEVETGRADRKTTRESLKSLVWTRQPTAVRVRAIQVLLLDQTEEGAADTRNMLALRLPTETDWEVIGLICRDAAARGWTDHTPALVRSYARVVLEPADDQRPERAALEALHPGVPVEATVYRVFATPVGAEAGASPTARDRAERARRDAWELLGRLDPDGAARRGLLADEAGADASGDEMLETLRLTARELRAVAATGSELEWAMLLRGEDAAAKAWWQGAAAAMGGLSEEQAHGLSLRHAEPVRWSAANRPEWLRADRAGLLAELSERLSGRRITQREAEAGSAFGERRERLRDNEEELVWGDVLAILVIDEALKDPAVVRAIFEQVSIDRRDTSTEHGGVILADGVGGSGEGAGFRAVHYPPRPAQRVNDTTFIAPEDLFRQSPTALAHYHFHVQHARNAAYAGPGPGDTGYADKHGRSCLVFTSIDEGTLNVDYYQRGGAVVDLGEVRAPR